MAVNKILTPPPITVPTTISKDNPLPQVSWSQWYNDLYFILSAANHQVITEASAVNLDARYVDISTSSAGGYAITLAAPTIPGVFKIIEMTTRTSTNDITLALTNCVGGSAATTCTFDTEDGSLTLVSKADKWLILKEQNVTLS